MGSASQHPLLAWQSDRLQVWRLLVMEYSQDRLRAEIQKLKFEIELMQIEQDKKTAAVLVAEILLCIVAFVAGVFVGQYP